MYISFARPIVYSSLVYSSPIKPIVSAVRADCVRRPIRLRPPSDQVASAVRSDCVRCPIRLRPLSGQIAFAVRSDCVRRRCSESHHDVLVVGV